MAGQVPEETDFKTRNNIRDKGRHFIVIKEPMQYEGINVYASVAAWIHTKQNLTELKEEIYNSTITVIDFNTPL